MAWEMQGIPCFLTNHAAQMRCFLWCLKNRPDLPNLPNEMIHKIWLIVSTSDFTWYTRNIDFTNQMRIVLANWEGRYDWMCENPPSAT